MSAAGVQLMVVRVHTKANCGSSMIQLTGHSKFCFKLQNFKLPQQVLTRLGTCSPQATTVSDSDWESPRSCTGSGR